MIARAVHSFRPRIREYVLTAKRRMSLQAPETNDATRRFTTDVMLMRSGRMCVLRVYVCVYVTECIQHAMPVLGKVCISIDVDQMETSEKAFQGIASVDVRTEGCLVSQYLEAFQDANKVRTSEKDAIVGSDE
jgi:hypothetical protein